MPFEFSNQNDGHIVITKQTYVDLKKMDASLGRLIEVMTTFHYLVGDIVKQIRSVDPSIDDADLT